MVKLWMTAGVAVACLGLLGCTQGTTVAGTNTATPAPDPSFVPPPPKLRTATPSPTPTEARNYTTGPGPIEYQAKSGVGVLSIRSYSWQQTKSSENGTPPKQRYLILDVEVTAKSTVKPDGTLPVNPTYLVAQAADGALLQPTMGADGAEPVMASREIKTGENWTGLVSYDIVPGPVTILITDETGTVVGKIPLPGPPTPPPDPSAPVAPAPPSTSANQPSKKP